MIRSLDDAWAWYEAVKTLALAMGSLARIWQDLRDNPESHEILRRANRLRELTDLDLSRHAKVVRDDLDDLAVLILFSVFELTVRDHARAAVDRETQTIQHPAVLRAIKDLRDAIENGSFGRVTESYKSMDIDLTEQVNQVRKFRNWVAHGRRGEPENLVNPRDATDRLRRYLARLEEVEKVATMGLLPDEPDPGVASEPE
jgi:hypothetical protein